MGTNIKHELIEFLMINKRVTDKIYCKIIVSWLNSPYHGSNIKEPISRYVLDD